MQRRTWVLFAAMLILFAIYAAMSLQSVPDVQDRFRAQTERLNSLDQPQETRTAHN